MREDPNGAALLEAASSLLREDVIGALPTEKRHAALMIANAMAIVTRQIHVGETPERDEMQALHALLGEHEPFGCATGAALKSTLVALNRQLARRLRSGDADPGSALHAGALAHLRQAGRQRVLESNPKLLKAKA